MNYQRYETGLFQDQLNKIRRNDKNAASRIDQVLDRILQNPENFDSTLKGPKAGQVKKKVGRFRIVYKYCQYCIRVLRKRCPDCDEGDVPSDAVVLVEVFHRDEGYD